MGYLSPFTDPIFQFFYGLIPLPTIIYWGIAIIIFLSGLVLYLTATDFKPEDILSLLPRTIVSIQKRIDKRKIGALSLIVLGFMATFTFSDRLIAEASNPPSGGGASLPSNLCTSSNIGTSSSVSAAGCQLPACNADTAILRCSTSSVTINVATGATTGSASVSFSPAFSAIPKGITITPRTVTATTVTNPGYTATFLATTSTGQTWTSMPAAQTEIFGDTDHEVVIVGSGAPFISATLATFSVTCPPGLGSSSATAVLRPMFSLDFGSTWNPVALSASGLDFGINLSCTASNTLTSNLATTLTAATSTNVMFRVDGLNGGGVGDNPVFTQIQLTFFVQQNYYPVFTLASKSASSMTIQVTYASKNQAGSITDTFDWIVQL